MAKNVEYRKIFHSAEKQIKIEAEKLKREIETKKTD